MSAVVNIKGHHPVQLFEDLLPFVGKDPVRIVLHSIRAQDGFLYACDGWKMARVKLVDVELNQDLVGSFSYERLGEGWKLTEKGPDEPPYPNVNKVLNAVEGEAKDGWSFPCTLEGEQTDVMDEEEGLIIESPSASMLLFKIAQKGVCLSHRNLAALPKFERFEVSGTEPLKPVTIRNHYFHAIIMPVRVR